MDEDNKIDVQVYRSEAGDWTSFTISNSRLRNVLTSETAAKFLMKEILDKLSTVAVEYYWTNYKEEVLKLIEPAMLQEVFVKKLIERLLVVSEDAKS